MTFVYVVECLGRWGGGDSQRLAPLNAPRGECGRAIRPWARTLQRQLTLCKMGRPAHVLMSKQGPKELIPLVHVHPVIKWCWIYTVCFFYCRMVSHYSSSLESLWPLVICSALCSLWIVHKNLAGFVKLTIDVTKVLRTMSPEDELLPLDLMSWDIREWLISPLGPEKAQFRDQSKRSLRRHWTKVYALHRNHKDNTPA